MKTAYPITEIQAFLAQLKSDIIPGSVAQLTEGHSSQVFSFENTQKQRFVIRIRESKKDLDADEYAFQHFSRDVPIPEVIEIGMFDSEVYYAITPFIEGETLKFLPKNLFDAALPSVKEAFAKTFRVDISTTSGYGDIDFTTGNAPASSWKESLQNELKSLDIQSLQQSAKNISLPEDTVDALVNQFTNNLPYVSEYRRLLHGDPGGDNVIVQDNVVIALIDWEQVAYGDWLRDFSRFELSGRHDYGNAHEFAETHNLESEHIPERKAVYWAINTLRDIEFADKHHSEKVAEWVKKNLERIIL